MIHRIFNWVFGEWGVRPLFNAENHLQLIITTVFFILILTGLGLLTRHRLFERWRCKEEEEASHIFLRLFFWWELATTIFLILDISFSNIFFITIAHLLLLLPPLALSAMLLIVTRLRSNQKKQKGLSWPEDFRF